MNSKNQGTHDIESKVLEISDSLSWLCNLSNPIVHKREKEDFIRHYAYNDTPGSKEFIPSVDHDRGIVTIQDRLAPDYEDTVYKIYFDDHTYVKAIHIDLLIHELLFNSSSDSIVSMHLEKWLRNTELAGKSASSHSYFTHFQKYLQ